MDNYFDLKNNIVFFDIETTGLDKKKDKIIQIGAVKYSPKWKKLDEISHYILPDEPWSITKEAFEKHGLTKEFIEQHGVPLKSIYNEWIKFIDKCDILTYNGTICDIPFMYAEFGKLGLDPMILNHRHIDVYSIERKINSNKLEDVYRRYTGKDPINAHDANSDSKMTANVFYEQLKRYNLNEIIDEKDLKIDFPEDILKLNDEQRIIFNGGKHKDEFVYDVCRKDPSYIKWLFENVLSSYSKDKIMEEYKNLQ